MNAYAAEHTFTDTEILKKRLTWLVNLRWGGIVGVLIATHVVREIAVVSFSLIPVYVVLGIAALCNLFYQRRLKSLRGSLERLAFVQIIIDQFILALSVYFSGGYDSPIIYFFLFHVVIGGIILPRRFTFAFAGTAVIFPSLILGLNFMGLLPHYGIFKREPMILLDNTMLASYGLAFISTVFLTAYFVTYLSRQLQEKNEEMLQLYSLSERLRSSIRFMDVVGIVGQELRRFVGASTSVYLPLNKEKQLLSLKIADRDIDIPLIDKNNFTDVLLGGKPVILDRRAARSAYEIKALDLMGVEQCMVLPLTAASLRPCHEYVYRAGSQCAAQGSQERKCRQLDRTSSHDTQGNDPDMLAACLPCERFTPVGVYVLPLPPEHRSPSHRNEGVIEASMRLLEAASLAVSNAVLHEKTIQLAKTDGLTGLKNHREFHDALAAELLRSSRYQKAFSLLMIDVDNFKRYNDTNGHPQGDVLLKKMARLIQDSFKITDVAARYGGEEFAVIVVEIAAKEQAVAAAERFRDIVARHRFPHGESHPGGRITVSIGVSSYPDDGITIEGIIKTADAALYRAKMEGKNRVVAAGRVEHSGSPQGACSGIAAPDRAT